jgi:heptaprenyl diphosphate synthase
LKNNIINKKSINIILICNAVVLSYLESFIPIPIPVLGVKLGLANIITIIAIIYLNLKDVYMIVILRCLVMALISKGLMMLVFSISAGLISATLMWVLYKKLNKIFSIAGISISGAVTHNIVQIIIASFLMKENLVFYYLPILLIAAIITGFINGKIANKVNEELKKRRLLQWKEQN